MKMTMEKLNHILQHHLISHHFQPICSLNKDTIIGHEVFLRVEHFISPEPLFAFAQQVGKLYDLDIVSIKSALKFYHQFEESDKLIFVNIYPSTIIHPEFSFFIQEIVTTFPVLINRIVLEINEKENITDVDTFKRRIFSLKRLGFTIAIDDLGISHASLNRIVEIEAEYIKLDRYFAQSLFHSKKKQSLVASMLYFCTETNAALILEGIEDERDAEVARQIGVTNGQGYHFGKPSHALALSI